ncbi:ribonuclease T [Thiohalophilus sp.]|uniref:ribonuclease T n=1 Tax=Thiohalophilus sp. TaxID=3028392 RepID=UPI002ACD978F|nr:ribonuclease T [Thiohalophilus sp.]MDZ7663611.1 ribonuclease T [Thiohalophilus sp.]MDZ7803113.1 ribonuclease T [Thiohalophilus sp.]
MSRISKRFRGFLPVVVDVETAGFDCHSHALLEIAAVPIIMNGKGKVKPAETIACHVEPFEGAQLDPRALEFTGIDPYHPFRMAKPEAEALELIFEPIAEIVRVQQCSRAILVGHNPFFDLGFIKAAANRQGFKKIPFHQFSTFDTATLGGLAFGQTVLARAAKAAGIEWDNNEAHSAVYDAERTAELFCDIVNRWDDMNTSE